MISIVSKFYDCQTAFWSKGTFSDKVKTVNTTALCTMATYISLQMLNRETYLDLMHNFSFITFPMQAIDELKATSIIYMIFALTFYNQNLKGKVAPWHAIVCMGMCGYLSSSTLKGYEILQPKPSEKNGS